MASSSRFQTLKVDLSVASNLLEDPRSSDFQERLKRWSNINLHTPAAIVIPKSSDDCQRTVKWAVSNGVSFISKSGGMSLYSTVKDGIVIDLSELSSIKHDRDRHKATLEGAIATKTVAVELAKDGFCTTLPSSNPVGAIPFFLGGGNSPLVSKLGFASDNIISARMITATGELINISNNENPELLYAIRGAGQYFGIVVSLTIRTYPVRDVFGNDEGGFWSGRFVFPPDRAQEVANVMRGIVNDKKYCTGGLIMIAAPPPARKPALVVLPRIISPDCETLQETAFKALYDLGPIVSGGGLVRIEHNADALQPLMAPGDFKKLRLTGIHSYDTSLVPQMVDVWNDLTTSCPDAAASMFAIMWESQSAPQPKVDSANSMHNIRLWTNNLTWCTSVESQSTVQSYLEKAIAMTMRNEHPEEHVDFANSVREPESPVTYRYKGERRLERLQQLKRKWDLNGVFGTELL